MDETSIAFLRECCPPEGYWVAFSGGKDSVVILDLVRRAGVKHEAWYSLTTVDPPELVQFIRREYPDVGWIHPKESMWAIIARKGLPLRTARFCCEILKEGGGAGRWVVTGIRHAESHARRSRGPVERGRAHRKDIQSKTYIHPIFNWLDGDVWQYIHERKLPYCKLYDEGHKRIGCVVCPFAPSLRQSEARWPKLFAAARRAWHRYYLTHPKPSKSRFETEQDAWDWWMDSRTPAPKKYTCDGLFV